MRRNRASMPAPRTDMVPMINVALVIVLTLMMISPFISQTDVKVDLPDAVTTETEDQDMIEVTYTREGALAIGEAAVTMAELEPTLAAMFAAQPSAMAVIKADEGIAYADVELVLAAVQRAGAPRIALATEQNQEARP